MEDRLQIDWKQIEGRLETGGTWIANRIEADCKDLYVKEPFISSSV